MNNNEKKILLCEDEDSIRDFVIINLERFGYKVTGVGSGEEAIEKFNATPNDFVMVLLDVMLPGIDGFTVCKEIRKINNVVGIIMLSAKSQEMDKVNGLMLGADDYITKPFSPSELTARIDALCRRVSSSPVTPMISQNVDELVSGDFILNTRSHVLTKKDEIIDLTQVEFQLMEQFLKNPNTALERTVLLTNIWGKDFFGDEKIVDVNVRRLRMKIEDDPSAPQHLSTVWGFGYKWIE